MDELWLSFILLYTRNTMCYLHVKEMNLISKLPILLLVACMFGTISDRIIARFIEDLSHDPFV